MRDKGAESMEHGAEREKAVNWEKTLRVTGYEAGYPIGAKERALTVAGRRVMVNG